MLISGKLTRAAGRLASRIDARAFILQEADLMISLRPLNQLSRHLNHNIRNSYATCVRRCPELQHALALFQETFDLNRHAYLDTNLQRLYGRVSEDLHGLYDDLSLDISVQDRWEAGELLRLLNALPRFLRQFDIGHAMRGGRAREILRKPFRDFLMDELDSHIKRSPCDAESGLPLIAFMAENGALSEFGLTASLTVPVERFRRRGDGAYLSHALLSLDDLLFLTYYTHSQTGLFNILTPAGRLHRHGHGNFRRAIFPLYHSVAESVEQLSRDPRFGVKGTFYKGLNLSANRWAETALWKNHWHDRFCAGCATYGFGSSMSAGRTLEASFASRPEYDYLAVFSGFRAADVSLLNFGECILFESQTENVLITGFRDTDVLSHRSGKYETISTVEFIRRD
jgi:hypothetical protein